MRTTYKTTIYENDKTTVIKNDVSCNIATATKPSDLALPIMDIDLIATHIITVSNNEKTNIEPDRFFKINDNYYKIIKTQALVEYLSPRQIRCLCRMVVND